ncbi:MAG: phage tail tape measure protein, partial [Mycobacterium sp.]|nr:phage tail tape measure protein [Mycobacterium sp.]
MAGIGTAWRTISVALQADTSGYTAGLQKAAAQTKAFGSEVEGATKGASAGMSGWTVAAAAVVAAGAGLIKIGANWQGAFNTLRRETGATGGALKGLESNLKDVYKQRPDSLKATTDSIVSLHRILGLSGPALTNMAVEESRLAAITREDLGTTVDSTAKLFHNYGIAASDQVPKLNELFRVHQQTGISISDLSGTMSRMAPITRSMGLSFEDSAAMVGLFSKSGLDASSMTLAFNKVLKSAADSGMSAHQYMEQLFNSIKNAKSPTEATGIAIQAFGTRGARMADLIRGGKLDFDAFSRSIASGGDTIDKAAKSTTTFSYQWTTFLHTLEVGIQPVASALVGAFTNILATIRNVGGQLVGAVGPAFTAIGNVIRNVVSILGDLWRGAQPVVGAFAAIAGAAVIGPIRLLASALQGISGIVSALHGPLRIVGTILAAWAINKALSSGLSALQPMFNSILSSVVNVGSRMSGIPSDRLRAAADAGYAFGGGMRGAVSAIAQVSSATGGLANRFNGLNGVMSAVVASFRVGMATSAAEGAGKAGAALGGLRGALGTLGSAAQGVGKALVSALSNISPGAAIEAGITAAIMLYQSFTNSIHNADKASKDFVSNVRKGSIQNSYDYRGYNLAVGRVSQEIVHLQEQQGIAADQTGISAHAMVGAFRNVGSGILNVVQLLTPLPNTVLESSRKIDDLKKAVHGLTTEQARAAATVADTSRELGISANAAMNLLQKYNIKPAKNWDDQHRVMTELRNAMDAAGKQIGITGAAVAQFGFSKEQTDQMSKFLNDTQAGLQKWTDIAQNAQDATFKLPSGQMGASAASIKAWYTGRTNDARAWSGDISAMIQKGFDPGLISSMISAGPEKAGPIVHAMVTGTNKEFVDFVNNSQANLDKINTLSLTMARITSIATTSHTRETLEDAQNAARIAQMAFAGMKPIDIARQLHLDPPAFNRIVGEFGLSVNQINATPGPRPKTFAVVADTATVWSDLERLERRKLTKKEFQATMNALPAETEMKILTGKKLDDKHFAAWLDTLPADVRMKVLKGEHIDNKYFAALLNDADARKKMLALKGDRIADKHWQAIIHHEQAFQRMWQLNGYKLNDKTYTAFLNWLPAQQRQKVLQGQKIDDKWFKSYADTHPADASLNVLRGNNPPDKHLKANADTSKANKDLDDLDRKKVKDKGFSISGVWGGIKDKAGKVLSAINPFDRWGSIHTYQAGGLTAHIATGQMFGYGEPATGGEALVPRLGDPARSLAILETAAGWYGHQVVPMLQAGGLVGGASP